MLIFDLETDGLLPEMTVVHCAWTLDTDTDTWTGYRPEDTPQLWRDLAAYPGTLVAHNGMGFDIDALKIAHGDDEGFQAFYDSYFAGLGTRTIDSLILSRLVYPDISAMDWAAINKGGGPQKKLAGSHSLRAWGERLGILKGDFPVEDFKVFSEEMFIYNRQDVAITKALMERLSFKLEHLAGEDEDVPACVELEHQFARYLKYQMDAGVSFDHEKAEMLVKYWRRELSRKMLQMRAQVPDIIIEEEFLPKVNNAKLGYVKGVPFLKRQVIPFNPRSSDHIIFFLTHKYGWKPQEFTPKKSEKWPQGKPKVTHDILKSLDYPEASLLARIKLLMERIALVAASPASLIRCINPATGRIHGRIIHNGTPTSRCRHSGPNLGNIPSSKATWGLVLRSLFKPRAGFKLVGVDADSLEMRLLAHYLYPFDEGRFFEAALNGSSAEGTDAHSQNMRSINQALKAAGFGQLARLNREAAKTLFYAILYGAWQRKVCQILMKYLGVEIPQNRQYAVGQVVMDGIRDSIMGLDELIEAFEMEYEGCQDQGKWPHLFMPDGRPAPIRGKHAVLNTACQTLGAVVMKVAIVLFMQRMFEAGFRLGFDWNPLLFVHDELQFEVRNDLIIKGETGYEYARRLAVAAIEDSGRLLRINVPLSGNGAVGDSWRDTH